MQVEPYRIKVRAVEWNGDTTYRLYVLRGGRWLRYNSSGPSFASQAEAVAFANSIVERSRGYWTLDEK